jgi:hypothetical protein
MTENSNWPIYPIGPRDSIFALGVVSVVFADLEAALGYIFATVLSLDLDTNDLIVAKIGSLACLQLIRQKLDKNTAWPSQAKDHITHFVEAFDICMNNRNHLIHSRISASIDHTFLFKRSKQGKALGFVPKLIELQKAADDMYTYIQYGINLSNALNNTIAPIFDNAIFPWPAKPPLPHPINYQSGPIPLH